MKKTCQLIGKLFLSLSALIIVTGPASLAWIAVEEMPESMKIKR